MKYPMKNHLSTASQKICSVLDQSRQVRYLVNSRSRYMRNWGHFTSESKISCCWRYNTQREISRLRMWSSFSDFRSMCKIGYLYQAKQQATICKGRAACMKWKSQASLRSRARNQRCCLSTKTAKTPSSARATWSLKLPRLSRRAPPIAWTVCCHKLVKWSLKPTSSWTNAIPIRTRLSKRSLTTPEPTLRKRSPQMSN